VSRPARIAHPFGSISEIATESKIVDVNPEEVVSTLTITWAVGM
jgi:hypothetical protein